MLHSDYNCKKCPAQEMTSACSAKPESKLAQNPKHAAARTAVRNGEPGPNDLAPRVHETRDAKRHSPAKSNVKRKLEFEKKFVQPELRVDEPGIGLLASSQKNAFFAAKLDDRSITSEQQMTACKAKLLTPLLVLHLLSQTPGIGSGIQPFSEFVISKGTVASIPASALRFN